MRVLVTGASGFVGRHLLPRLRRDGCEVIGVDRELDVADAPALEARVAGCAPDAVVHLAAQSSVAESWRQAALTYRVNFLGARSVLEAVCRRAPRARLLMVGSGGTYGSLPPGSPPFDESAPLRPVSPYARTKAAADLLGATYAARGLCVLRLRPFNHTGPGQSEAFVLSSFARQLAEIEAGGREPELRVGNLDSVRDFLDVEDVVEAYARLVSGDAPPCAYNVASGVGRRIGDLLEGLVARARVRPRIRVDPERVRPVDQAVGDAGRLRRTTGWEPRTPLDHTLERLLGSWRRELSAR